MPTLAQVIAAITPLFEAESTPPVVNLPPAQEIVVSGYNTKIVHVDWERVIGSVSTRQFGGFHRGDAFVFVIDVPAGANSSGAQGFFKFSPTDGNAYIGRKVSLSNVPGDFSRAMGRGSVVFGQEGNVYFTVGGYPKDRYGRVNDSNANLDAGGRYYVTVVNDDGTGLDAAPIGVSCDINFGLSKPAGT